jgi:hypothetical protein
VQLRFDSCALCFSRAASRVDDSQRLALMDTLRQSRKRAETALPNPVSLNTFAHSWAQPTLVALCDGASLRDVKCLTQ